MPAVIREWLGANPRVIKLQAPMADIAMDGTASRAAQYKSFWKAYLDFFGGG